MPALVDNVTVHWHIPVGCGFSGFFVEFLGVAEPLRQAWPELAMDSGECADQFYADALFPAGEQQQQPVRARPCARGDVCPALLRGHPESTSEPAAHIPPTPNPKTEGEALRQLHRPSLYEAYDYGDAGGGAVPSPHDESWLHDVDLSGGDLPRSAAGLKAASARACQAWCVERRACVAWTFRDGEEEDDGDEAEGGGGTCWLKGEHVAGETVFGLTSGRVYQPAEAEAEVEAEVAVAVGLDGVEASRGAGSNSRLRPPPFRVDVWHGRCNGMPSASSSRWRKCYAGHCIGWGGAGDDSARSTDRAGIARNQVLVARLMTESEQIMNTQEVLECSLKVRPSTVTYTIRSPIRQPPIHHTTLTIPRRAPNPPTTNPLTILTTHAMSRAQGRRGVGPDRIPPRGLHRGWDRSQPYSGDT